jgi:hypothetical protein
VKKEIVVATRTRMSTSLATQVPSKPVNWKRKTWYTRIVATSEMTFSVASAKDLNTSSSYAT